MTATPEPDPDRLLADLQRAAPAPSLPPLGIGEAPVSARRGLAGRGVDGFRRAVLRVMTPTLVDLLDQLERDRHRLLAEIDRLGRRVDELERRGAER